MNRINKGRLFSLLPCILVLLPSSLATTGYASSSQLTVDLGYSVYQGISVADPVTNKTNTNFLGIRYAAPPVATLRFVAPHLPVSTSGVQIAGAQPNRCWAANSGTQPVTPFRNSTAGAGTELGVRRSGGLEFGISNSEARSEDATIPPFDEDCLFLNVFVPGVLEQNQDLPVVVWIHGGGYVSGSASGFTGTDIQDGNDLIREANNGVIAVVIQYRLGLFGFLPGQKVKDGGALNAGLLDQQFALQWINKFGGDPAKVAIWGESAGAGSVLQHLIANGGNTQPALFRAAITSSTFLPSQYKFNDRIPEVLYTESVSQSGCSNSTDTLACLRKVDVNTLQATNVNICNSVFFGTFAFVPVVDGTLITGRPIQLLKQGKVNGEIIYSVTNTFEGALFVDQSTANTVQIPQYVSQLFPAFESKEIKAAQAQYAGLGSNIFQAVAIMGESIFICPTYFLLRAFKGRAFKGEFAIPPGGHGNDLAYYFPTTMNANGIPPYGNSQFDASFAESFLKFVLSLNPNAKFDSADITPHWTLWQGSNEMLFNRTEGGNPDIRVVQTSNALLKRCEWLTTSTFTVFGKVLENLLVNRS